MKRRSTVSCALVVIVSAVTARAADETAEPRRIPLAQPELSEARRVAARLPEDTRIVWVPKLGPSICLRHCEKSEGSAWYIGADPVRLAKAAGDSVGTTQAGGGVFLLTTEDAAPSKEASLGRSSTERPQATPPSGSARVRLVPNDPTTRQQLIDEYFESIPAVVARAESGSPSTETLQILGQIVADRASGAAVELVFDKLVTSLGCVNESGAPNRGALAHTCAVLQRVRLQELAQRADVLVDALALDLFLQLQVRVSQVGVRSGNTPSSDAAQEAKSSNSVAAADAAATPTRRMSSGSVATAGADTKGGTLALDEVTRLRTDALVWLLSSVESLLPELSRARRGAAVPIVAAVASHSMTRILRALRNSETVARATRSQLVVLTAALGFAQCAVVERQRTCPVAKFVLEAARNLGAGDDAEIFRRAESLLIHVLSAQELGFDDRSTRRDRAAHAIDALFDSTCLSLDLEHLETTALLSCPARVPNVTPANALEWLSVARYLLLSAVEGEHNGLLVAAGSLFPGEKYQRGFRLLGGILKYSRSYVEVGSDPSRGHAQRTKLLEELTTEMTDRSERRGDYVWSFGGALSLVGGVKLPLGSDDRTALYGPLGLPLGIGLQRVGSGIHFMAGIVDLGQYLAWKPGLEVAEPRLEDAISPSLTLGYGWGKSFPVFAGVTVGYSPHYQFTAASNRGAVNLGVSMGVYVPLLDVN